MIEFLKKKERPYVDLIDFSRHHVSTGKVVKYILTLYEDEGFSHLGYRYENDPKKGDRFVIYTTLTLSENWYVVQYFKDRCPGMVEEACRKLEGTSCSWETLPNGVEVIQKLNNE